MPVSPNSATSAAATSERSAVLAMVTTMARMQAEHNAQVHPQWRSQGYPYYRAIWMECAELIDHYGWKWWKHQQADLDQVRLELVDIWHFGLSDLLRNDVALADIAQLFAGLGNPKGGTADEFRDAVEAFALRTGSDQAFSLDAFIAVLQLLPMTLTQTFELYVGKNVLNHFRQDHGYKSGEYRKLWQGREDNEHLIEALAQLACTPDEVPAELYAALAERYAASS
ncbi:MAG: dUTP diphosphatase [Pseudomonadales bacterium]